MQGIWDRIQTASEQMFNQLSRQRVAQGRRRERGERGGVLATDGWKDRQGTENGQNMGALTEEMMGG